MNLLIDVVIGLLAMVVLFRLLPGVLRLAVGSAAGSGTDVVAKAAIGKGR